MRFACIAQHGVNEIMPRALIAQENFQAIVEEGKKAILHCATRAKRKPRLIVFSECVPTEVNGILRITLSTSDIVTSEELG